MKLRIIAVVAVVYMLPSAALPASADSATSSEAGQRRVDIQASTIESWGSSVRAIGNVRINVGNGRMTAEEALYNWDSETAELKRATFTTCSAHNPDYHIEARSLSLLPGNRLRARRIALFFGKTKVLSLPVLRTRIGGPRAAIDLLPRISYDSSSGFGLTQRFALVDTDRATAVADVTVSSLNGLEADLDALIGLDGKVTQVSIHPLSYAAFRSYGLTVPVRSASPGFSDSKPITGIARLRQFTRFSANARSYNVQEPNLLVDRQPEIGLQYVAPALSARADPVEETMLTCPQINVSWGRFREAENVSYINRTIGEAVVPVSIPLRSKSTRLQPAIQYSRARYGNGATYAWFGYSLGVTHFWPDGSLAALRYINRTDTGSTPFLFDRLVVEDEFQGAIQVPSGKHVLGFVAGYDTARQRVYDWSVLYAWRTDCLAAFVSWSNLERQLAVGVRLAGL